MQNKDQRPHDYSETDQFPRPSHADWTYLLKYGVKASSGGGRSSARETIGRVAAGAIAEKYLKDALGVEFVAFVSSVGKVHMPSSTAIAKEINGQAQDDDENDESEELQSQEYIDLLNTVTREQVDASQVRCPDEKSTERMVKVRACQLLYCAMLWLKCSVCSVSCERRRTTTLSVGR